LIEITPRVVHQDVSFSDARNLTSNGVRILDEGQTTDLAPLLPGLDTLKTIQSEVQQLKDAQKEMIVPYDDTKK
jgi:hypothetical protein